MYNLLNKISAHWSQKMQKNLLYFFVILGEMLIFCMILFGISNLAGTLLVKTSYFAQFSSTDISTNILMFFFILLFVLAFYCAYCENKEYKKAREKLENRQLSDYVKKHQKYVNIVEEMLNDSSKYKSVCLENDWVKSFDTNLAVTAWECHNQKHNFTDFEVAACLMYALTRIPSADGSNINLQFAFNCVKSILATPSLYDCKYTYDGELILEESTTLDEVCISDTEDSFHASVLQLLEIYISQRENFSKVVNLANFLHIFYLSCKK